MKPIDFTQADRVRVFRRMEYLFSGLNPGKKYRLEVKEYREKRSLDANAYAWKLIGEIAADQGIDPNDVYRACIRKSGGTYVLQPVRDDAVDRWVRIWEGKGAGWMADVVGPAKAVGYVYVRCWYGSSVFDSKEMSNLIGSLRQDCELLGLPYLTPEEEERLLEEWDG